jgi:deazaflavin-dependent oxidoreductase (nitroreductase family)
VSEKREPGLPADLAGEEYCYLTTTGRVSGRPHEIEIWFGLHGRTLYLLSGGGERSDWVKNLRAQPAVSVRIAQHNFAATARLVSEAGEDRLARELLANKYDQWEEDQSLGEWARTALPVALDLQ